MQDIYSAIVGEPPTEREKLQAIAQQLRKRQMIGQLGQITGDKVLAPMGSSMVDTANTQAEGLGRRGEQARYRRYQEDASNRMDERARAEQLWRERNAIEDRAHRERLEAMRNKTALEAARIRETGDGEKKYNKMPIPSVMKLTGINEKYKNMTNVVYNFKDEYAGTPYYGGRALKNTLAANVPMLTSKESEDAAKWWAEYNLIYTLGERNKLFGATLTDNEQAEWKKNAINENMTAEQIRERLEWLKDKWGNEIKATRTALKGADYDPALIDDIFPEDEVKDLEE